MPRFHNHIMIMDQDEHWEVRHDGRMSLRDVRDSWRRPDTLDDEQLAPLWASVYRSERRLVARAFRLRKKDFEIHYERIFRWLIEMEEDRRWKVMWTK